MRFLCSSVLVTPRILPSYRLVRLPARASRIALRAVLLRAAFAATTHLAAVCTAISRTLTPFFSLGALPSSNTLACALVSVWHAQHAFCCGLPPYAAVCTSFLSGRGHSVRLGVRWTCHHGTAARAVHRHALLTRIAQARWVMHFFHLVCTGTCLARFSFTARFHWHWTKRLSFIAVTHSHLADRARAPRFA